MASTMATMGVRYIPRTGRTKEPLIAWVQLQGQLVVMISLWPPPPSITTITGDFSTHGLSLYFEKPWLERPILPVCIFSLFISIFIFTVSPINVYMYENIHKYTIRQQIKCNANINFSKLWSLNSCTKLNSVYTFQVRNVLCVCLGFSAINPSTQYCNITYFSIPNKLNKDIPHDLFSK